MKHSPFGLALLASLFPSGALYDHQHQAVQAMFIPPTLTDYHSDKDDRTKKLEKELREKRLEEEKLGPLCPCPREDLEKKLEPIPPHLKERYLWPKKEDENMRKEYNDLEKKLKPPEKKENK